jgi:uncharacterized protein (DUF1330 family)
MAAYAIGRLTMRDPSWRTEYLPKTAELVVKHGGRDVVRGGAMERREGPGALPSAIVVLEFPSMAQAKAWSAMSAAPAGVRCAGLGHAGLGTGAQARGRGRR